MPSDFSLTSSTFAAFSEFYPHRKLIRKSIVKVFYLLDNQALPPVRIQRRHRTQVPCGFLRQPVFWNIRQDRIWLLSESSSEYHYLNCHVYSRGGGRRLLKIPYQDHPPICDVTSGLNCTEQLVSQSENMAFRLAKIFLYLQTITFVSFHSEDRKMLQTHFFDFWSKMFDKREQISIVWAAVTAKNTNVANNLESIETA